jgi:hypothetical protein
MFSCISYLSVFHVVDAPDYILYVTLSEDGDQKIVNYVVMTSFITK